MSVYDRVDVARFDLRRMLPRGASRMLGMPGGEGFERLRRIVMQRPSASSDLALLTDAELGARARELAAGGVVTPQLCSLLEIAVTRA
ncbi:MAG: hypothetical protein WA971_06510, partial [Microbacterium sp.]